MMHSSVAHSTNRTTHKLTHAQYHFAEIVFVVAKENFSPEETDRKEKKY